MYQRFDSYNKTRQSHLLRSTVYLRLSYPMCFFLLSQMTLHHLSPRWSGIIWEKPDYYFQQNKLPPRGCFLRLSYHMSQTKLNSIYHRLINLNQIQTNQYKFLFINKRQSLWHKQFGEDQRNKVSNLSSCRDWHEGRVGWDGGIRPENPVNTHQTHTVMEKANVKHGNSDNNDDGDDSIVL